MVVKLKTTLYISVMIISVLLAFYIAKSDFSVKDEGNIKPTVATLAESIPSKPVIELSSPRPAPKASWQLPNTNIENHSSPAQEPHAAVVLAKANIEHANIAVERLSALLEDNEQQVNYLGGYLDEEDHIHLPETTSPSDKLAFELLEVERQNAISEMEQYRVIISESEEVLGITE